MCFGEEEFAGRLSSFSSADPSDVLLKIYPTFWPAEKMSDSCRGKRSGVQGASYFSGSINSVQRDASGSSWLFQKAGHTPEGVFSAVSTQASKQVRSFLLTEHTCPDADLYLSGRKKASKQASTYVRSFLQIFEVRRFLQKKNSLE